MRALIWGLGLFALAVVLTLAAHYNTGYVLIAVPTHRIEISLNLALLLVVLACVLFHLLARGAQLMLTLPAKARVFRRDWRRRQSAQALEEALNAWFESRLGRAERAAQRATEPEHRALAGVIAARASHELRNFQARDDHLARMQRETPERAYLRLMAQAEMLLQERRYHDALDILAHLPEKHSEALKLELRAHQLARNWDQVLALLPQLERRRVFDADVIGKLRRQCHRENLARHAGDAHTVREYWRRIAEPDRLDAGVALSGAEAFLSAGARAEAGALIEKSLSHHWAPELLASYTRSMDTDARRHLERCEEWLKSHPRDADLLLALGRLCVSAALWGKARSYLEASLALEERFITHVELARLLEQMDEGEAARSHSQRALELAAEAQA